MYCWYLFLLFLIRLYKLIWVVLHFWIKRDFTCTIYNVLSNTHLVWAVKLHWFYIYFFFSIFFVLFYMVTDPFISSLSVPISSVYNIFLNSAHALFWEVNTSARVDWMQDDIKPQNIKMWTKYTHTKHMLHILIHIDDKLGGIGWVKNV
jgi:hypothetical protein